MALIHRCGSMACHALTVHSAAAVVTAAVTAATTEQRRRIGIGVGRTGGEIWNRRGGVERKGRDGARGERQSRRAWMGAERE